MSSHDQFMRKLRWVAAGVVVLIIAAYAAFFSMVYMVAENPKPIAHAVGELGREVADGYNGKK